MTSILKAQIRKRLVEMIQEHSLMDEAVDCAVFDIEKLVDSSVIYAITKGCNLGEILDAVGLRIS